MTEFQTEGTATQNTLSSDFVLDHDTAQTVCQQRAVNTKTIPDIKASLKYKAGWPVRAMCTRSLKSELDVVTYWQPM